MGSLLEELARREVVVRQRIEEIRERIAELNGLLEVEEDRLTRLVIARETVQEIVGEAPLPVPGPAERAGSVEFTGVSPSGVSPPGVVTVPLQRRWRTQ